MEGARDVGLAEVAEAQRGLAHRDQLVRLGITRGAIAHRLQIGTLHRILPRVFAVGHRSLQPLAPEVAALLYVGDDCVLSHASAAAMWGIAPPCPQRVELTQAGRNVRQQPGVRIFRVRELDARDVRLRQGIPVTAPARTVLDLAGREGGAAFDRALAEARVLRLVSDSELEAAAQRCPTRAGAARVRGALRAENERSVTRSQAERRLLSLIGQAGLKTPETNVRLLGYEVDLLWRAERLVVEVDGHTFHAHRAAFERDRARDQVLVAAGYRVIRITWRQLEREPLAVLVRIAGALQAPAAGL